MEQRESEDATRNRTEGIRERILKGIETGKNRMAEQNLFTETLHLVQEIAKTSTEPMDRETALSYFKDQDLTKEQEELVYQYLLISFYGDEGEETEDSKENPEAGLSEEGQEQRSLESSGAEEMEDVRTAESGDTYTAEPEDARTAEPGDTYTAGPENVYAEESGTAYEEESKTDAGADKPVSTPHFQMYVDEVSKIASVTKEEEQVLYERLLMGDASVMEKISNQWLSRVIELARPYQGRGALLDDLVQEGNIGLLLGLQTLSKAGCDQEKQKDFVTDAQKLLEQAVCESIEQYLSEHLGEQQEDEAVVGKVSLVHQAKELLKQENNAEPTLAELSEYTKIPAEEIQDILSLIKEKNP